VHSQRRLPILSSRAKPPPQSPESCFAFLFGRGVQFELGAASCNRTSFVSNLASRSPGMNVGSDIERTSSSHPLGFGGDGSHWTIVFRMGILQAKISAQSDNSPSSAREWEPPRQQPLLKKTNEGCFVEAVMMDTHVVFLAH